MALIILVFSRGWMSGELVLDGPGVSMYVRLALDHWRDFGLTYWMPELWAGTPAWALAPSFPVLALVPFGALFGPDTAVKLSIVAAQIAGGWGALVLARYFWGRAPAALVAGLAYGLHPLMISHGALYGQETSLWVMGATPWLAWSLIRGLRGDGARYVMLAGVITGFAILQQAEHAYSLALLCACLLVVEVAKARGSDTARADRLGILKRAGVVVAIGLGLIAHWLLPLVSMGDAFVFTPGEAVEAVLVHGVGGELGREPGTFLERSGELSGAVSFDRADLLSGPLYLGWVSVGLTLISVLLLGRRDHDGHLSAILLAGAIGMWMSTGGVPLADSSWATGTQLVPFAIIGATTGLLVGSLLRRLQLPQSVVLVGALAAAGFLALVPYLTPFLTLQKVVPFLASVRFPRFYPIAVLGLALGAAYPLTLIARWAHRRNPNTATVVAGVMAFALSTALLVDAFPYRSYYGLKQPEGTAAYQQVKDTLQAVGGDFRVATPLFGDPRQVDELLKAGRSMSVGWPHPIASRDVWRITGEAMNTPPGWRDRALGLSSTAYVFREELTEPGPRAAVRSVQIIRNPQFKPLARTYDQALVVADADLVPELAVDLAQRNVAVVKGGASTARRLGPIGIRQIPAENACRAGGTAGVDPGLVGELLRACALHNWIGTFTRYDLVPAEGAGGLLVAPINGLRGVAVWLDRFPGPTELVLHEIGPDNRLVKADVRRVGFTQFDDDGLSEFLFEPVPDSAGRRYLFTLVCAGCQPGQIPSIVTNRGPRDSSTLVLGTQLQTERAVAFSPLFGQGTATEPASATALEVSNSGTAQWQITADGPRPSLLVVAESYFPGWKAEVDGKKVPIVNADGGFIGVPLPAGQHRVTLSYATPAASWLGRLVTIGTIIALLAAAARLRRRRKQGGGDARPGPGGATPAPGPGDGGHGDDQGGDRQGEGSPLLDPSAPDVPEPPPPSDQEAGQAGPGPDERQWDRLVVDDPSSRPPGRGWRPPTRRRRPGGGPRPGGGGPRLGGGGPRPGGRPGSGGRPGPGGRPQPPPPRPRP